MAERFEIDDIRTALDQRLFPTVLLWNRLEGRPRTQDFSRALRAEVRDALWMIARQWQLGEFRGDDSGSPASARIHLEHTRLDGYQAGLNPPQPYEDDLPLEALVEGQPVHLLRGDQKIALDLRLQMGRRWLKLLEKNGLGSLAPAFRALYRILPPDPKDPANAGICAHPEAWARFAAAAGRAMDGGELYLHLKSGPPARAGDGIGGLTSGEMSALDGLAGKFTAWYEALYLQPGSGAWQPDRLEYRFAVSTTDGQEKVVFAAPEYSHGRLEWYNLDQAAGWPDGVESPTGEALPPAKLTRTFLPTPVSFDGMPDTRWWAFEDRRTNFGDVRPDTTDLAKLLLVEFGLVYANDWFLLPVALPVGSVSRVGGLVVDNVFGERFWIEPTQKDGGRWDMFRNDGPGRAAVRRMLLLPAVAQVLESEPVEEVAWVRDEVANMVWGIELVAPLPDGTHKAGREAALETTAFFQRLLESGPGDEVVPYAAPIYYRVMNSVPENWIPFVPVRTPGTLRDIQLQRAAMPRLLEGDPNPPVKVRPRTELLRVGLDEGQPYFLHEEEVPRAGVRVSQAFQRTRWYGGRVVTWLGVRKEVGRGEASSGLAFDQVLPSPPDRIPAPPEP